VRSGPRDKRDGRATLYIDEGSDQAGNAAAKQPPALVIIDIANPRDVEEAAATIDNVQLHNIDDLRKITEENLKRRRSEIGKVVAIINQELNLLEEQYKKARANELIAELYQSAEELRVRELEKARKRMQSADDLRNYQQI